MEIERKKQGSDGFWCCEPGCNRFFQFLKHLENHNSVGQHSGGLSAFRVSKTSTSRNTDKAILINKVIAERHESGQSITRPDKKRAALTDPNYRCCAQKSQAHGGKYKSVVSGQTISLCPVKRGTLRKVTVKNPKLLPNQSKFLQWTWNHGERTGKKISSRNAALLMTIHGTVEGQLRYPDDPYWTALDVATFRRRHCLSHWRIKTCFDTVQQLKKKKAAQNATSGNNTRTHTYTHARTHMHMHMRT